MSSMMMCVLLSKSTPVILLINCSPHRLRRLAIHLMLFWISQKLWAIAPVHALMATKLETTLSLAICLWWTGLLMPCLKISVSMEWIRRKHWGFTMWIHSQLCRGSVCHLPMYSVKNLPLREQWKILSLLLRIMANLPTMRISWKHLP